MRNHSTLFISLALLALPLAAHAETKEAPVPVRMVRPTYPQELLRDGVNGVVTISCTIDEKGAVKDVKVEKASHQAFSQPAVEAVARWKFKPAKLDGVAVPQRVTFPIEFKADA